MNDSITGLMMDDIREMIKRELAIAVDTEIRYGKEYLVVAISLNDEVIDKSIIHLEELRS